MSEKPILLSGEMVRAILEGRKSMTRRVVKPQPPEKTGYVIANEDPGGLGALCISEFEGGEFPRWINPWRKCPYGKPGDVLWVRETFKRPLTDYDSTGNPDDHGGPNDPCFGYRADMQYRCGAPIPDTIPHDWKASIHMPRVAARLFLRVKSVRVERVQDIAETDALREGATGETMSHPRAAARDCLGLLASYHKSAFALLWDSLNAKRGFGWDVNPWVWVVEFERCEEPKP